MLHSPLTKASLLCCFWIVTHYNVISTNRTSVSSIFLCCVSPLMILRTVLASSAQIYLFLSSVWQQLALSHEDLLPTICTEVTKHQELFSTREANLGNKLQALLTNMRQQAFEQKSVLFWGGWKYLLNRFTQMSCGYLSMHSSFCSAIKGPCGRFTRAPEGVPNMWINGYSREPPTRAALWWLSEK